MDNNIRVAKVDCKKITFFLTVKNLKCADEIYSEIFHIRGQPWQIKMENNRTSIFIGLISKNTDKSDDWAIFANAKFKVISNDVYAKPYQKTLSKLFTAKSFSFINPFITLKEFVDPNNGYCIDDSCKLEIKVESSELQNVTHNYDQIKMVSIRENCDNCSYGEYQLRVKLSDAFIGVATPQFFLRSIPFRFAISKSKVPIGSSVSQAYCLKLHIYNEFRNSANNWSCHANMHYRLVPSNASIQKTESETENITFEFPTVDHSMYLILWNDLVNPEKSYIEKGTVTIAVELNITQSDGFPQQIHKRAATIELECPICLENLIDRAVCTIKCGHMFCNRCIEQHLLSRKFCPVCKKGANISQLYLTILPLKN